MGIKRCAKCGAEGPEIKFTKDRNLCKKCRSDYNKSEAKKKANALYYEKNKARIINHNRRLRTIVLDGIEDLLNPDQVAEILGCSLNLVYVMANRGQIPIVRWECPGAGERKRTMVRFKPSDIKIFIQQNYIVSELVKQRNEMLFVLKEMKKSRKVRGFKKSPEMEKNT